MSEKICLFDVCGVDGSNRCCIYCEHHDNCKAACDCWEEDGESCDDLADEA